MQAAGCKDGCRGKALRTGTDQGPSQSCQERRAVKLMLPCTGIGKPQNPWRFWGLACWHCLPGPLLMMTETNGNQSSSDVFSSPLLPLRSHLLHQQNLAGASWFLPSLQVGPGQQLWSWRCLNWHAGILCLSSPTCHLGRHV